MLAWRYSPSRSADAHLDKITTRPPPTPMRLLSPVGRGPSTVRRRYRPRAHERRSSRGTSPAPRRSARARRAQSAGESDAVRAAGKEAPPRDVPRIRTKVSALNGISLQERLEHRRPADHERRRPRSVGVEPEIFVRRSQGGSRHEGFEVLVARKRRRALRAHLRADVAAHLGTLGAALVSAQRSRATSSPDLASLRRT
jgi:hypothetical protein